MTTILIVDDDPMDLESTKAFLETHGFSTICAKDGEQALLKLNNENADLALIDLFIPKVEELDSIASLQQNFPIIAISDISSSQLDPLSAAESLGARATLSKPFAPKELLKVIEDILHLSRPLP